MDPVSGADRFVRLLRQRLEERAKAQNAVPSGKVARARPRDSDALSPLTGALARAGADDDRLRRSLVEQLLADHFGPALVNDAKFQQVVDDVTQIMASDESIGPLLNNALGGLRAQGL
jgi:hypothetical protein